MSATASLPDLRGAIDASRNAQIAALRLPRHRGIARGRGGELAAAAASPRRSVDWIRPLHIDVSGLSQRLPQAISTIENAMPADALRFVEELKGSYEQVSGFLQNSELVRQVRAGATLEQTALALIDDVLALFRSASRGPRDDHLRCRDARTREDGARRDREHGRRSSPFRPTSCSNSSSENLLGVAPDLLGDASAHVHDGARGARSVFARVARGAHRGRARWRRDRVQERRRCAGGVRSRQPCGLCAARGAVADARLRTRTRRFAALEALYAALTTAVSAPAWDTLFAAYAEVLDAIDLEDVPTVDDAVDAMAETVEAMLSRLSMSLSPEDLARQVALTSASIHELFAQSALAQVRQTLIAFLGRIQTAIEQVPTEQVDRAVKGMLERVHQEIQNLGIDQVSTTIRNGFQTAHDFVDHNIDDKLLKGVSDALAAALQQFQNIPIAELGQQLASAIQAAGEVIRNLEQSLASGLHEIETLLASLDGLNFRPVADEVVDEIKALKSKLAAIRPESLSDVEKVAIQGALSMLRAIDLDRHDRERAQEGLRGARRRGDQGGAGGPRRLAGIQPPHRRLRRRIARRAGDRTSGPGREGRPGDQRHHGLAPLEKLVDELTAKARALSPGAILDPLQDPYKRMMQTIQRANPDVWVTPLRALHAEIDRLIELINITPLLTTLEQKEKELFAQAQQAIASGARRRASAGAARRLLRRDEGDRARSHRRHLRRSRRHAAQGEPVADREDETELAVPAARSRVRQAAGGDQQAPGAGHPRRVRGASGRASARRCRR